MPAAAPRLLLDAFPYEILENIIFNIPNYKPHLQNCALASKAFIIPAQRSIFFSICLSKASFAPNLIHIFKRSPHLGTYVRELELDTQPKSTEDARNAATLFRLMPSVYRLILTRLDVKTPWDTMRSSLEDVILPHLRYLKTWNVYDAPVWLLSSCSQLDELFLNDCPSVPDGAPVVNADFPPLRYLRIAHFNNTTFNSLCRSVTQLVALDLSMRDWWYGIEEDRTDMPLTRLTELMNPMANTLVHLDIDAWPILHLSRLFSQWFSFRLLIPIDDRKITNHPFFIGQYPHLRYFYIRLGVPRFREHDDLQVEDLATQIAWLSSMLCEKPSTYSHPLSYINIHLDKWWWLDHTDQPTQMTWHTLDLALAGNHSITYTHLKELQLSPVFEVEDATYDIEKLLPLALERGVLVVTKEREGWSLLR